MRTKSDREIIICPRCQGSGQVRPSLPSDVGATLDGYLKCPKCLGSGRLMKITTVEEFPFNGVFSNV